MCIVVIVFVHYRVAPSGSHCRFDLSAIGIREIIIGRSLQAMKLFSRDEHEGRMRPLVNQLQNSPGLVTTTFRNSSGSGTVMGILFLETWVDREYFSQT